MQLENWIPAITTTGALSLALWLFRSLISARLTSSVQHEFDQKLEKTKSEFRATERALEMKLAQRSAELEALRSGALSGITQRRALLDKRRLEAIDQLWGTLVVNQRSRSLAMTMAVINLEEIAKQVENDERVRQFLQTAGAGFDPAKQEWVAANLARPYLSNMAWALYSAIQAITGYYVVHWTALSKGIDSRNMISTEAVHKLILAAAPEYEQYLKEHGLSASFHLLERLDTLLLEELNRMAIDREQDAQSIKQAADILEQARNLSKQANEQAAAG